MGRDTIAEILTSNRNAEMNKKGTVRIASTNITENPFIFFGSNLGFSLEGIGKELECNNIDSYRTEEKVLY